MKETVIGVVGLLIFAALAVIVHQNQRRFHKPLLTTHYQAVMLTDGTLLHGRIDHLGTDFPVLREAMTVHAIVDPASGTTSHKIVLRKNEAHGADHLILPATSIIYVEPVQTDSTIGRAIEQFHSR